MTSAAGASSASISSAAAVLLALIYHCSISYWDVLVPGATAPMVLQVAGLFGVQLFFALSGYLIGNILLVLSSVD